MVSVKKSALSSCVFFSKIGPEIIFSYGLERKEAFEDDKNVQKMGIFPKGFTHGFGEKVDNFFIFFFQQKSARNNV